MSSGIKTVNLSALLKNKYALIVLAVGLILLLLPTGSDKKATEISAEILPPQFSISAEEDRIESRLSQIEDVGKVSVLLSVEGSVSRKLAKDGDETLVVSGDGSDDVVELYYVNPTYNGAVVVCEGAGSPTVRLSITNALRAYTGLSSDKISVNKMESS